LGNGCLRGELNSTARWRLVVLILELALFAIILVLPQVDLPDFTFRSGMAPIVLHSRLCSSPLTIAVAVTPLGLLPRPMTRPTGVIVDMPAPSTRGSRLSQLCTLIC
jgi:hypothetical protein